MNRKIASHLLLSTSLAAAFVAAGCADTSSNDTASGESGDVASETQKPIAVAERDGFLLRYYELEGGGILEVENGSPWADSTDLGGDLDYVQRYELISGAKAPAALLSAAAKIGQSRHDFEPVPSRQVSEPPQIVSASEKGITTGNSTETWFRQNYCVHQDRFWGGPDTQGLYYQGHAYWSDRVEYMKAGAWSMAGLVAVHFMYSGAGFSNPWWSIGSDGSLGHQWVAARATSTINRDAVFEVVGDPGELYLACLNYHY